MGPRGREARAELGRGQSPERPSWGRLEIRLPHRECGQLEASSCQLAEEGGWGTGSSVARHLPSPHVTGAIDVYTGKPLDAPSGGAKPQRPWDPTNPGQKER